jgi:hypothetical protein
MCVCILPSTQGPTPSVIQYIVCLGTDNAGTSDAEAVGGATKEDDEEWAPKLRQGPIGAHMANNHSYM